METGACTAAPATMITRNGNGDGNARWALGRTYGAQKRSEQATRRGVTAMLPRSGRVDDNIDTVATDLRRISSCVPLPYPYSYPRVGSLAKLLTSDRCTLHEDGLLVLLARIGQLKASLIKETLVGARDRNSEEEDYTEDVENEEKREDGTERVEEEEVVTAEDVNSNRLNHQNVRRRFCA